MPPSSHGNPPTLTAPEIADFRALILRHFRQHGRRLPWRETRDPYAILVSEVMLQQTGVERVAAKYGAFLERFPDIAALALANLAEVLALWQGLGYNRRALHLLRLAREVVTNHGGRLPESETALQSLPGIGPATAGALAAFAFGRPAVFLETNIRRVFLHFFYPDQRRIADRRLLPLVAQTLDRREPRCWYYALMDYGAWLKTAVPNPNRNSAHYSRQSRFEGSDRQLRGLILRTLVSRRTVPLAALARTEGLTDPRLPQIIRQLAQEGFLELEGGDVTLATGKE